MAMFDDAKVGDKVWSFIDGWGEIVSMGKSNDYPIRVQHDKTAATYTLEGKGLSTEISPTLFWDEVKIVPPERPKVRCECGKEIYKHTALCLSCLQDLSKPKVECEACDLLIEIREARNLAEMPQNHRLLLDRYDKLVLNKCHVEGCDKANAK